MFRFEICEDESLLDLEVSFNRIAIRGVIIRADKILLVKSNRGDYKFPGGGLKFYEKHEDTLIREVMEETGYKVNRIFNLIGEVREVFIDKFKEDKTFIMDSYYYRCEVLDEAADQCLDTYEEELGFSPEWVSLKEAISNNEDIIERKNPDNIEWIGRETLVLKSIYKSIINKDF